MLMQFVRVLALLHIKAWLERADGLSEGWTAGVAATSHEASIVVQKAEETVALTPKGRSKVVGDEAWEEGHVVRGGVDWDLVDAVDLWRSVANAVDLHVRACWLLMLDSCSDDGLHEMASTSSLYLPTSLPGIYE